MPGRPRKNFIHNRKRRASSPRQYDLEFSAESTRVTNAINAACADIEAALPHQFFLLKGNKGKRMRGQVQKFRQKLLATVRKDINAGLKRTKNVWLHNNKGAHNAAPSV
jgi:hypothetical protein